MSDYGGEKILKPKAKKDFHRCSPTPYYYSCMIGKETFEDFPKAKRPINRPLYQVHMDSFSSSVKSIEGYKHAIVFVDAATEYRWLYGLKTKDDAIKS